MLPLKTVLSKEFGLIVLKFCKTDLGFLSAIEKHGFSMCLGQVLCGTHVTVTAVVRLLLGRARSRVSVPVCLTPWLDKGRSHCLRGLYV